MFINMVENYHGEFFLKNKSSIGKSWSSNGLNRKLIVGLRTYSNFELNGVFGKNILPFCFNFAS
jgi:hypothetical protein